MYSYTFPDRFLAENYNDSDYLDEDIPDGITPETT